MVSCPLWCVRLAYFYDTAKVLVQGLRSRSPTERPTNLLRFVAIYIRAVLWPLSGSLAYLIEVASGVNRRLRTDSVFVLRYVGDLLVGR